MFRAQPIRPLSFGEILDDLVEESPQGHGSSVNTSRKASPDMDWLFNIFVETAASANGADASRAARHEAYFEEIAELPAVADDEEGFAEDLAEELALSCVRSLAELKQIRRSFALRNHPDILHPALRAEATRRMKIANMLIDRRGKELARQM
jgi:hypothetical protein